MAIHLLSGDLSPTIRKTAKMATNLSMVDARVSTGFIGHSYFYSNPAVLSDLILILRDNLPPGRENGRPLEKVDGNFWRIEDDYPAYSHEAK